MKFFSINILLIVLIIVIEFGKSMGAIILPILASLILLVMGIVFWINIFGLKAEKKYTILFLGGVSIYTFGTIINVLMYN